ncbi:MAG: hypothetical protein WD602_04905 [Actinomycetota bacterium]
MIKKLLAGLLLVVFTACSGPAADDELPESSAETGPQGSSSGERSDVTLTVESTDAGVVVEHLKEQGLPIGRSDGYSAENSPFKPLTGAHLYQTMAIFNDTRVDPVALEDSDVLKFDESGGIVETFASREDLRTRVRQIEAVRALAAEQDTELEPEYQIRQGTILLRLGHVMEPWTGEYEQALASYEG